MSFYTDLRRAFRHLRHSPGYATAAVLTFAVAIGANSAIFGAVHAVLLKPLPVNTPEDLAVVWQTDEGGQAVVELTYRHLREWSGDATIFSSASLMASHNWSGVLQGRGEPSRIWFAGVSGTFFDTLGVAALHGRTIQPGDDVPNGPAVAVLNHAAWVRRFGADAGVVGSTMTIDGGSVQIVGVMPAGVDFPRGAEFWMPAVPLIASGNPPNLSTLDTFGVFYVLGRLRPGVSAQGARARLDALEDRLDQSTPGRLRWGAREVVTPFVDHVFGPVRRALWALWCAVAVLLLIACANVSGLLLTRVADRRRDHGVRLALGATRATIARLWGAEVLLIAIFGGLLGMAAGHLITRAIVSLAPDDLPRLGDITFNGTVALFTLAAVGVAALVTGAGPAFRAGAENLTGALDGARSTSSRAALNARSGLLVLQVGLAIVLLVAAGLVVRSFVALRQIDLGFQPDRVLTATIQPRGAAQPPNQWMQEFLTRVRALPGVESAGAVYLRPLMLGPIGQGVRVFLEGQPETRATAEANPTLNHQIATPGYFETMRVPLERGRFFTDQDVAAVPRVAIVSVATANRLWPGQDPIGRRLLMATFTPGGPPRAWRTVVGVVGDVRYRGLADVQLDVYDPALQVGRPADNLVVRTSGAPLAVASAIQRLARDMDAGAVVDGATTMESVVARAQAPWRLGMWMFLLFGAVSFGLAVLGLVSVVALDVSHRGREFAIRLALGASRGEILRGVLVRTGWRVGLGIAAGFGTALLATRAMRSLLFETGPGDPLTYGLVLASVAIAVSIAAWLPARRAAGADPQSLLRQG